MALPGVVPADVPAGMEDVSIRRGAVPERLAVCSSSGTSWELHENHFLLRLPNGTRILASHGRTLAVEAETDADLVDAMPFLLGTGFGVLLLQRGGLVLHASAVAVDGRAYLFCGPSGIGKSTLAAALCEAGCRFVNDDVCSIQLDNEGRPQLSPDGRRLKLFDESIEYLGIQEARRCGEVRSRIGKHYVAPPGPDAEGPIALGAVYILHKQNLPADVAIERLSPLNAAQELLDQSYRSRLALAMARRSDRMAMTGAILNHVPVFTLPQPRGLDRLPANVAQLRAHWQTLPG